ncbi:hypothetical protein [Enterococcus sp. 2201sp1_2201st1_B8_2201SCRN_220225]|uniref:hypothetical protein n=1 Tax=unclassified Enterococcus TaxID=2608891 RepID=UPI0034A315CB
MKVKELINHLQNLDENLEVELLIEADSPMEDSLIPITGSISSIEFSKSKVILKGLDDILEQD